MIHMIDKSTSVTHNSDVLVEELIGKFQVSLNMNKNELETSTSIASQESSILLKVADTVERVCPKGNVIHFHQSPPPKKACPDMKQSDGSSICEHTSDYSSMLNCMHRFSSQEDLIEELKENYLKYVEDSEEDSNKTGSECAKKKRNN